jgi:hypothetical protein
MNRTVAGWKVWRCRRRGEHDPKPWTPLIPLGAQPWEWAKYKTHLRCLNCGWEEVYWRGKP